MCFLVNRGGESERPLDVDVATDESSDPARSSCGLDAVGVVDGDGRLDEPTPFTAEAVEAKLRNMAKIESAELVFDGPNKSLPGRLAFSPKQIIYTEGLNNYSKFHMSDAYWCVLCLVFTVLTFNN